MIKENDISIVILLFNTPKKLIKNLKNYKDFKILVLDQSNDKKLEKFFKNFFPKLEFYKSTKKNLGFAKGINFLIRKVKTKYFLCTQPDIIIQKKSILNLKKPFKSNENCILSVPEIKNFKNYKRKKKDKIYKINDFIGAIFMGNKKKFVQIKMFDERFFFYWEDVDLSNRILKSKYNIFINHSSKATHTWSSTKFNLSSKFIKSTNFKFGEYLYQYKNNKLKIIKILRQPIFHIFLTFIYLILFNHKKCLENLFCLFGIIKFLIFICFSKNKSLHVKN